MPGRVMESHFRFCAALPLGQLAPIFPLYCVRLSHVVGSAFRPGLAVALSIRSSRFFSGAGRSWNEYPVRNHSASVRVFSVLLGNQHVGCLHGNRLNTVLIEYQSAIVDSTGATASLVGLSDCRWIRTNSLATLRFRSGSGESGPVLFLFLSCVDRNDWFLGNVVVEHS